MAVKFFVVGGGASGKSAYAERLARAAGTPKTYIATLQPFDDEMRAKVDKHQGDRGDDWTTVEAPLDLSGALQAAPGNHVILVDCLTLWLTNVMLADRDLDGDVTMLLDALAACPNDVIVVSNEVGLGIVPDTALGRRFRDAQGALNQRIAAAAETVVTVIAGLPLALKGKLPALGPV